MSVFPTMNIVLNVYNMIYQKRRENVSILYMERRRRSYNLCFGVVVGALALKHPDNCSHNLRYSPACIEASLNTVLIPRIRYEYNLLISLHKVVIHYYVPSNAEIFGNIYACKNFTTYMAYVSYMVNNLSCRYQIVDNRYV